MADRKPIRWAVPRGGESYMGLAAYFLTHEENMRQAFSQPSRRARRTLSDGTTIDYIMNDVVDFIQISPPQGLRRAVGKAMTWDKLPPFELDEDGKATENIDLSQMTEDPDVSGGYYCTVSVINGTDEMGRMLPAEFSVDTEDSGWSIEQIDSKSARLKLGANVEGECEIIARNGKTELRKKVKVDIELSGICFRSNTFYFLSVARMEKGYLAPVVHSGLYTDISAEFHEDDSEHFRYVYTYDANNTMTQHSYIVGGFGQETTYYDGLSNGVPFGFYSVVADVYTTEGNAIKNLPAASICMIGGA